MRFLTLKIATLIIFVSFSLSTSYGQAPAQSQDVMLQGFYWDSNATTSWNKLYQISGELSGNFDIVWLPPSAYSSGGTGYMPKQWNIQNSDWGTKPELQRLINALKTNNCRAMADIVVNHRDSRSGWMDFYPDDFSPYGSFTFNREHICYNDEAQYSTSVPSTQKPTGANDTGENFDGARDLDHTKTYVQDAVKAYLQWMKNDMQFDGWRYDMVKGFSGSYINGYNAAGGAYLSVGEYWDAQYNAVWNWIQSTGNTSTAFDFPMKYAALNNGLAAGNYAAMAWSDNGTMRPAGLIHSSQSRRYAVTFVDNHDTYRDASKYTGDVLKAYAYILSAPGIPCVFYPHWRDNKSIINAMIKARKSVGLNSESAVEVQNTNGYYKAYSVGTCGEMITYIGASNSSWATNIPVGNGWTKNLEGTGWAIYTKINSTSCGDAHQNGIDSGINPEATPTFTSITIKVIVPSSWTTPKIHVWNKGVDNKQITTTAWPGDGMTKVENNTFSITLSGFSETNEVGIVFNNGASTGTLQTIDFSASKSTSCWILSHTPTTGVKYDGTESADCFQSSTQTIQADDLMIYPNPVTDKLYINSSEKIENVSVFSLTGGKIENSAFINDFINVSTLQSGIYFLKVLDVSGKSVIQKFIKE